MNFFDKYNLVENRYILSHFSYMIEKNDSFSQYEYRLVHIFEGEKLLDFNVDKEEETVVDTLIKVLNNALDDLKFNSRTCYLRAMWLLTKLNEYKKTGSLLKMNTKEEILEELKEIIGEDTLNPLTLFDNIKNSVGTTFGLAAIFAVEESMVIRIKECLDD